MTIAGSINNFDLNSFIQTLAGFLQISTGAITPKLTAGSIHINLSIELPNAVSNIPDL